MKSKLLLALVGMAAMFTGCNKENVEDFATGKQATSFNVSVDGGVKTRGEVTPPEEAPKRYVMEIYKGATAAGGTFVSHKEQATGTFTDVVLDDNQEYTVLFWADYGTPSADGSHQATNEYNTSDLKAAVIAKQPTKAAFAGLSRFTVGGAIEESVYTKVTLDHAVAQVNFKQTEALTAANNTLAVSFDKSCSLNVDGNVATEISGAVEYTFTRDNDDTAGTLGTSYIIAATGEPKTMLEITATLNGETAKAISNVPFERNYKTNISGAYSDKYSATLKVTCEEDWGTPDYNEDIKEEEPGASYTVAQIQAMLNEETSKIPAEDAWTITDSDIDAAGYATLRSALAKAQTASRKISIVLQNATVLVMASNTGAFEMCSALTSLDAPKVTDVQDFAVFKCVNCASVSLPLATTIGKSAFLNSALVSVTLPEAKSIGTQTFSGCTKLKSASFPKAETLGQNMFDKCTSLTTVAIGTQNPATLTSVGQSLFSSGDSGIAEQVDLTLGAAEYDAHVSGTNWTPSDGSGGTLSYSGFKSITKASM